MLSSRQEYRDPSSVAIFKTRTFNARVVLGASICGDGENTE
jgi:hypothetical protein